MTNYNVPKELLEKINKVEEVNKEQLMYYASDIIFKDNYELFDLILSQTNFKSQRIIYNELKNKSSDYIINQLLFYKDNPVKQERIVRYDRIKIDSFNEAIYMDMFNIENEYVENSLYKAFINKKIKTVDDYFSFKKRYERIYKIIGFLIKNRNVEVDMMEYKKYKILRDNVLIELKSILRNYGYLGIDLSRLDFDDKKNPRNVKSLFDENNYNKLFEIINKYDAINNRNRYVLSTYIMNGKSELNKIEIMDLIKSIMHSLHIDDYTIRVSDKELVDNAKEVFSNRGISSKIEYYPDMKDLLTIYIEGQKEFFKVQNSNELKTNIDINELTQVIHNLNKDRYVKENNNRNVLIYGNNNVSKELFDVAELFRNKYNCLIVYEEDISKEELYNYCITYNFELVVFVDEKGKYDILRVTELIDQKKLTLTKEEK